MRGYRADIAFDGERALPGGALVLVEDGVIVAVEPGSAAAPDGCPVTHLPGAALLPGLIDTLERRVSISPAARRAGRWVTGQPSGAAAEAAAATITPSSTSTSAPPGSARSPSKGDVAGCAHGQSSSGGGGWRDPSGAAGRSAETGLPQPASATRRRRAPRRCRRRGRRRP